MVAIKLIIGHIKQTVIHIIIVTTILLLILQLSFFPLICYCLLHHFIDISDKQLVLSNLRFLNLRDLKDVRLPAYNEMKH